MAFADDIKATLAVCRSIPGQLGLRPHLIEIGLSTWSGAHVGDGTETTAWTSILENGQNPKVRWLDQEEIAVGGLEKGTVEIGPLTPGAVNGGSDIALLAATSLAAGGTRHLRITGPEHPLGAIYEITELHSEFALHFTIRAKPVANTL